MSKSIKRAFAVISVSAVLVLGGCTCEPRYHDGDGKSWIMEQVEKGFLTQEEANELLKQEAGEI